MKMILALLAVMLLAVPSARCAGLDSYLGYRSLSSGAQSDEPSTWVGDVRVVAEEDVMRLFNWLSVFGTGGFQAYANLAETSAPATDIWFEADQGIRVDAAWLPKWLNYVEVGNAHKSNFQPAGDTNRSVNAGYLEAQADFPVKIDEADNLVRLTGRIDWQYDWADETPDYARLTQLWGNVGGYVELSVFREGVGLYSVKLGPNWQKYYVETDILPFVDANVFASFTNGDNFQSELRYDVKGAQDFEAGFKFGGLGD